MNHFTVTKTSARMTSMCGACKERQAWLLEAGDGSQVICWEAMLSGEDGMEEDAALSSVTPSSGLETPCGDKRKSEPSPPNAPKRKMWKPIVECGDGRHHFKGNELEQKPRWMDVGCKICRKLFRIVIGENWIKLMADGGRF